MKHEPPVLPPLLFLVFGIVGLLWLVEPALVGANQDESRYAAVMPASTPYAISSPGSGLRAPAALGERLAIPAASPLSVAAPVTRRPEASELAALDADRRSEREPQRAEVQRRRELDEIAWLRERSAQIAQELELGAGSAEQLERIFVEERDRQSELWLALRDDASSDASRQRLRDEMSAIRRWRESELERAFGSDLALRIAQAEKREALEQAAASK